MGRILGLKFANTGKFLPVLVVREIQKNVQTTLLRGQSLLFSQTGVSQYAYFTTLLSQWTNVPMLWAELSEIPANLQNFPKDFLLIPQAPPVQPVNVATATLLAVGVDPLKAYWMDFAGNFNLYFPLFRGDWQNTVGTT